MLSIAHSAKRVSINGVAFVASIIFTILCPVLAKALNIEPLNDCANGASPRDYTFSCQQTRNYFDSTEALPSTHVIAVTSDFLDHVQSDVIAADLSTDTLLSGVSVTGTSGAASDANDGPDRVPESPSLTLMCISLVAGLGIHLRKTISRNTPFAPEP